jgi:hypothetical protein
MSCPQTIHPLCAFSAVSWEVSPSVIRDLPIFQPCRWFTFDWQSHPLKKITNLFLADLLHSLKPSIRGITRSGLALSSNHALVLLQVMPLASDLPLICQRKKKAPFPRNKFPIWVGLVGWGWCQTTQQGSNLVSNKLWPQEKKARARTAVLLFRVGDGRSMNARNQSRLFFLYYVPSCLARLQGGKKKERWRARMRMLLIWEW